MSTPDARVDLRDTAGVSLPQHGPPAPPPPTPTAPVTPTTPRDGQHRRRRRRPGTGVMLAAVLAGGLAGGAVSWLTRPEASTSSAGGTATTATGAPSSTPSAAARDPLTALPALITRITKSVVAIDVVSMTTDDLGVQRSQESAGSGFVMDAKGLIATNAHVVAGATRISVKLPDGSAVAGTVQGRDVEEDLAVVKVARRGLVPLPWATSHPLEVGDFVIAAGNALALEGGPSVTVGIVSALGRSVHFPDGTTLSHLVQTDAAISSGDSGGPLLSASGDAVGITTAGASSTTDTTAQNIGFAIPITRAASTLKALAGTG